MSTPDSERPAVGSGPAPTVSPVLTKPATEQVGSALGSRLRIERELGRGGMAIVYLARDVRHDRAVAVKVFREALAESVGAGRFLREIQIAAQLQHPHIVALLDSGEA